MYVLPCPGGYRNHVIEFSRVSSSGVSWFQGARFEGWSVRRFSEVSRGTNRRRRCEGPSASSAVRRPAGPSACEGARGLLRRDDRAANRRTLRQPPARLQVRPRRPAIRGRARAGVVRGHPSHAVRGSRPRRANTRRRPARPWVSRVWSDQSRSAAEPPATASRSAISAAPLAETQPSVTRQCACAALPGPERLAVSVESRARPR